ncbi:MAG: SpoIIE family protein phosphatase [Spirochaetes bacterium]|nr:SpoIIE family protein phosphatase [Spirochaetota bacterium]
MIPIRVYSSILFILVISLSYLDARAVPVVSSLDSRTSLAGDWKLTLSDNKKYSSRDYDDSGWLTVSMPGSVTRYLLAGQLPGVTLDSLGRIEGICWLRKTVVFDRDLPRESVGLILGQIANADETYFNGVKIGGMGNFPPHEFSMWNHPRHYVIPKSLIKYGEKNVISVRISFFVYCEMLGTLAIAGYDDWSFDRSLQNFIRVTMNYVIIFMGLPLLLMFGLYFVRKRNQEYLFYVLQLVAGLFIVLDACDYFFWHIFGSTLLRLKLLGFSWAALNVVHPIFLHRIYQLKRKKIEIGLWIYLVLIAVMLCTVTGKPADRVQAIILIALTTPIGLYNLSCHISAFMKRHPDAPMFGLFGIIVILGAIHDGFVYFPKFGGFALNIFGYTPENMIFGYTAAALYVGTSLLLITRLINTMDNLDELNVTLEKRVHERTEQLASANDELQQAMEEVETINEELIDANHNLKIAEYMHERDLAMAVNMQSSFLPERPPESGLYDIAFIFRPMAGISGDFYDFYKDGGELAGVGIFDVSGHGISSGLITLIAKSIIYETFMRMKNERLNTVFDQINRKLIKEIGHIDNYLTGILVRMSGDTLEYVNSGHPDMIYRMARSSRVGTVLDREKNSIAGPFMGTREMEQPYRSLALKISSGDCLMLYTDCLNETGNNLDASYDESRILRSFKNAPDGSAREILDSVMEDFYSFAGRRENFKDDLTVIVIKKK